MIKCSRCSCIGLHACIGRELGPPTPTEEARINAVLDRIFSRNKENTLTTEENKLILDNLSDLYEE